jgi:hypothetical protein
MATTHVAFDTRSGRILSAHYGPDDPAKIAQSAHQHAMQYHAKVEPEHIAVIAVPAGTMESGKQYKVDPHRKALVAVSAGESGVSFGFGVSAKSGYAAGKSS